MQLMQKEMFLILALTLPYLVGAVMCDQDNKKDAKYEVYINERNSLVEAIKSSSNQFDKAILTLVAGALALSLTFVDKISPTPISTEYILTAWILFSLSLLFTLISFLTSRLACEKQIENLESEYFDGIESNKLKNPFGVTTSILNYASILLFLLGVVFLILFCWENLKT